MSPSETTLRLRYEVLTVDVSAEDGATLEWLAEFLDPAFESVSRDANADADHHVRLEVAPARYAGLERAHGTATLTDLEGFSFDGSFSLHRGRIDEAGWTWIRDEKRDVFFGVSDDRRDIEVVTDSAGPYPRVALMRVLRELGTIAMYEAKRLPVHGAGFVLDGGAVLICGPKRAGKTSLLVHALDCCGVFVSNDRLFVDPRRAPSVRGMPTIVMLRDGTLALFDRLRRAYDHARFDRARTVAACAPEVERPPPTAPAGFDRPGISPAQLCALLSAPMVGEAPIRGILFPAVDKTARGLCLERLAPGLARAEMAHCLLKPSDPVRFSQVFAKTADRVAITSEAEIDGCKRLLERVPAYRCRLGPDAYDHDIASALLRAERAG